MAKAFACVLCIIGALAPLGLFTMGDTWVIPIRTYENVSVSIGALSPPHFQIGSGAEVDPSLPRKLLRDKPHASLRGGSLPRHAPIQANVVTSTGEPLASKEMPQNNFVKYGAFTN